MKKFLILILITVLVLVGVFLWKGGHHALFLMDELADWADEDASEQYVSVTLNGMTLSGDTFWTGRGGRRVYGLDAGEYGIYLRGDVLYMDTGTAYTLPQWNWDREQVQRLLLGAVLYGRVTKVDGAYLVSVASEALTLHARILASDELESVEFALNAEGVVASGSMSISPDRARTIPQAVVDAMIRADMEPPMSLAEPLNALLPALDGLDPLRADVTLGVECGILTLSETAVLHIENGTAVLERGGERLPLSIPDGLSELSPVTVGLVLLRNGAFTQAAEAAEFRVTLDAQTTAQLCEALVPQIGELGVSFEASEAVLTIRNGTLESVSMTAGGSVPFLITTIPVAFTAQFDIQ